MQPSLLEIEVRAGPRRERADLPREGRGIVLQREPRVLAGNLRRIGGARGILRLAHDLPALDPDERFQQASRAQLGEARAQLPGVFLGADRSLERGEDGTLVEFFVHPHRGHAGFGIPRQDRGLDRGGAPVSRQDREVDVERAEPWDRQNLGGQDLAVGDENDEVGVELLEPRDLLGCSRARRGRDRDPARFGRGPHRRRGDRETSPLRTVPARHDERGGRSRIREAGQGGHREIGRAVEHEAHGAR